jgi:high-affinity iron transporter
MLPTFVIGLREGLEAALIVGIVAAFLRQEGRRDALRPMWAGVGIAVAICVAAGVGLQIFDSQLPQRQQEMLETVIGVVAVGMVTFMIFWMVRHAAGLKAELQGAAASALASGSVTALVLMAFAAVFREGFETAVFLLAAFNNSSNALAASGGALLGILTALAIGYGIYRGGIRLNLHRFFRATAAVLVLIAAGLVAMAFHTGHEAGWVNFMQGQALDLTWLVKPGTVSSALLTGMLGLQPRPVGIEVISYLLYAVPMLTFVLWPRKSRPPRRATAPNARTSGGRTAVQPATS